MKEGNIILEKGSINYKFQYKSKKLLIIKTGAGGGLEGYMGKYNTIARRFLDNNFSVLVCDNDPNILLRESFHYTLFIADELMKQNNIDNEYEIYYFGVSRGASSMMQYGYEYSQIKKAVLVNPSLTINWDKIAEGLTKINNKDIHVIIGSKDICSMFFDSFKPWENKFVRASLFKGADHYFSGLLEEFINLPNEFL